MSVRVGILDTGVDVAVAEVHGRASFLDAPAPPAGAREHGGAIARIVLAGAPAAALLDARAFVAGQASTPARIGAALDWLLEQQVDVINMSFGLRHDRAPVAAAVERALAAGALCVASTPAQGAPVYPAHYPGVVAVSGDARCSAGEFSQLRPGPAWHFGAANGGPQHRAHQRGLGASFACAHLSGALARRLGDGLAPAAALDDLAAACRWSARECRR